MAGFPCTSTLSRMTRNGNRSALGGPSIAENWISWYRKHFGGSVRCIEDAASLLRAGYVILLRHWAPAAHLSRPRIAAASFEIIVENQSVRIRRGTKLP